MSQNDEAIDKKLAHQIASRARSRAKMQRVIEHAEAHPRLHQGRPHTIHTVDGYEVHLKRFAPREEHGINVDVEIFKDGKLFHSEEYGIVNPPGSTFVDGVKIDDPVLAIVHTVLEHARAKK